MLDIQSTANTNEIAVLQNRINMLEEIIKNLVNIDVKFTPESN
jgi:conjugal transfer/entry exclusion protein